MHHRQPSTYSTHRPSRHQASSSRLLLLFATVLVLTSGCGAPNRRGPANSLEIDQALNAFAAHCNQVIPDTNNKGVNWMCALWRPAVLAGASWASAWLDAEANAQASNSDAIKTIGQMTSNNYQRCVNAVLSEEAAKGPPDLRAESLGPSQLGCWSSSRAFQFGAVAIVGKRRGSRGADRALTPTWP